jgi:hypothetical protein
MDTTLLLFIIWMVLAFLFPVGSKSEVEFVFRYFANEWMLVLITMRTIPMNAFACFTLFYCSWMSKECLSLAALLHISLPLCDPAEFSPIASENPR